MGTIRLAEKHSLENDHPETSETRKRYKKDEHVNSEELPCAGDPQATSLQQRVFVLPGSFVDEDPSRLYTQDSLNEWVDGTYIFDRLDDAEVEREALDVENDEENTTDPHQEAWSSSAAAADNPILPLQWQDSLDPTTSEVDEQDVLKTLQNHVSGDQDMKINSEEELECFGMIRDIPLKLLKTDIHSLQKVFAVALVGVQTVVTEEDSLPFAMLHPDSSQTLQSLREEVHANYQLYCEIEHRGQKNKICASEIKSVTRRSKASMHAVIFGPASSFEAVGDFLQERGVYLQDPIFGKRHATYRNPHRLFQVSRDDVQHSSPRPVMPSNSASTVLLTTQEDPFSSMESVLTLIDTDGPPQVKTRLYAHQKQALTYMLRRERGWAFDGAYKDIYKAVPSPNGRVSYINTVSGEEQLWKPPQFCGGILADPMGLGKSLSIIALVASTIPERSELTAEKACHGTLLVVPYSLISNWEKQLKLHLHNKSLSWVVYHGSRRKASEVCDYDVVITTYHTIAIERKKINQNQTIFHWHWHRIVLDEAHMIRCASTNIAKAVCLINASNRWAVTGTPIQNRLTDLVSIITFLGATPYCYPRIFDEEITRPWRAGSSEGLDKLVTIMRALALRRPKSVVDLPKRNDEIHFVTFDEEEIKSYHQLRTSTFKQLDDAIHNTKRDARLFLNALQWINSLRQFCNLGEGYLAGTANTDTNASWSKRKAQQAYESMESTGLAICAGCNQDIAVTSDLRSDDTRAADSSPLRLFECLQLFCGECFHSLQSGGRSTPLCGCGISCKSFQVSPTSTSVTLSSGSKPSQRSGRLPCKVRRLLEDLKNSGYTKSVIFSSWVTTLNLVAEALEGRTLFTRLDGRMKGKERAASVEDFSTNSDIKVLLVSMNCGAVGIDLTAATHVYLMEPQWNPMIEDQALDRVHRIGQTKPVTTIRYIVKGSFEESIRNLQSRKRHLADITVSQSDQQTGNMFKDKLEFYRSLVA